MITRFLIKYFKMKYAKVTLQVSLLNKVNNLTKFADPKVMNKVIDLAENLDGLGSEEIVKEIVATIKSNTKEE